jgi:hypothetical protein
MLCIPVKISYKNQHRLQKPLVTGYYDNVDVEVPDGYICIGCMESIIRTHCSLTLWKYMAEV